MPIEIAPFQVAIPDSELDDLRSRLDNTIWPDDPGNDDWSYGVNAAYLRSLVDYWRHEYDWREAEARINAFPNYKTVIDEIPVHFIHRRGNGPNPIPLILTHGWPCTFWDMHKVIEPLADPAAHGGDPADAFDVIVPSLPGYGFSGPPGKAGLSYWKWADLWQKLMTEALGYPRYASSGGDWGSLISSQLGHKYADSLYGIHIMHPMLLDQFNSERPWDATFRAWDTKTQPRGGRSKFVAHLAVQNLDPQSLAYGITDSPVGMLAWFLERWRAWGDTDGDPEKVYSREHMITSAMIFWLSRTAGTAIRAHADSSRYPWRPSHDRMPMIEAPTGITFLGGENPLDVKTEERVKAFEQGPRAKFFNTVYLHAHPTGGHFGYYENPQAVIHDVRAMFRMLR